MILFVRRVQRLGDFRVAVRVELEEFLVRRIDSESRSALVQSKKSDSGEEGSVSQ